eukprot:TRINITY_DN8129_c0_g1_i3.p1 TRINITY_DN8129_c0_g1~~TRINITY_DN8129_c0_g1_i3.p1  ORF type:complete len:217 (-),score=48.90 TRINITY_DN8129_c0_g1_i3:83-733(-)
MRKHSSRPNISSRVSDNEQIKEKLKTPANEESNRQTEDDRLLDVSIQLYNKMKELNDYINNTKSKMVDHSYLDGIIRSYGHTTERVNTKPINPDVYNFDKNAQTGRTDVSLINTIDSNYLLRIKEQLKSSPKECKNKYMSEWSTRECYSTDKSDQLQPSNDFVARSELWLKRRREKIMRKRMASKVNELSDCTFSPSLSKKENVRAKSNAREVNRS